MASPLGAAKGQALQRSRLPVPGITAWPAASRRSTISRPGGRPGTWSPSVNQGEADNFGLTRHLGHDERYDAADEFLELTFQLWDSWQPNALVLDREEGIYADPARVRPVDHKGRFFSCRGPLNIPRSPQGRPVIIQAGSSACGQDFAARWAEIVFSIQPDEQGMRRFYLDHRSGPSGRAAIRLR